MEDDEQDEHQSRGVTVNLVGLIRRVNGVTVNLTSRSMRVCKCNEIGDEAELGLSFQ